MTDRESLQYGPDYCEEFCLRDGTPVLLRPVRPSDKDLLRRGFDGLSPESRYRRFLLAKGSLSEHELEVLTNVDGWNHVALGALHPRGDGGFHPMGIARFVRDEPDGDVAEAAVTVVDAWQRRGLGGVLLRHLAAAARERGVRRLRVLMMAANVPMRSLADELGPAASVQLGDGRVEVVVDLSADSAEGVGPASTKLLGLAAQAG